MSITQACKRDLLAAVEAGEDRAAALQRLTLLHGPFTAEEQRQLLAAWDYAEKSTRAIRERAAQEREAKAQRYAAARDDDLALCRLLLERLPGIIERLEREPLL